MELTLRAIAKKDWHVYTPQGFLVTKAVSVFHLILRVFPQSYFSRLLVLLHISIVTSLYRKFLKVTNCYHLSACNEIITA